MTETTSINRMIRERHVYAPAVVRQPSFATLLAQAVVGSFFGNVVLVIARVLLDYHPFNIWFIFSLPFLLAWGLATGVPAGLLIWVSTKLAHGPLITINRSLLGVLVMSGAWLFVWVFVLEKDISPTVQLWAFPVILVPAVMIGLVTGSRLRLGRELVRGGEADATALKILAGWAAEEIVREGGLDYTIIKAGVVYGRGDHMLDHLSHAFHTFPIFALVGFEEKTVRPLAVEDLIHVLRAALIDRRLKRQTVALVGPEEMFLSEAVRRVAEVVNKQPLMFPLPIWCHRLMARFFEFTMTVPLVSSAQVRILSEGVSEPGSPVTAVPYDLVPTRRFSPEQIRNGLPHPAPFCVGDLRLCS